MNKFQHQSGFPRRVHIGVIRGHWTGAQFASNPQRIIIRSQFLGPYIHVVHQKSQMLEDNPAVRVYVIPVKIRARTGSISSISRPRW